MKISFDGKTPINLDRLIETRALIQANSGGGKSWAVRRLLEQTHSKVQHIVIDVDDEFHTLRENFDYVLAGKGGDCPADTRCASQLALKLLELNVSAIVNIYELKHRERIQFVKLFLDSMVNAPKELWHPCLVVIDEAHIFAPQHNEAESASSVIDLMTRGRKRGFCGILCTQRISKLHKDAAAEANNKLIGRSALDVDMKRAADEIGFTTREQTHSLRTLSPGQFYSFGPAFTPTVELIKVGSVQTTHPKIGQRQTITPPRAKVQKILEKLADLPAQVEKERVTIESLQSKVRELENQLKAQKPVEDHTKYQQCFNDGATKIIEQVNAILPMLSLEGVVEKLSNITKASLELRNLKPAIFSSHSKTGVKMFQEFKEKRVNLTPKEGPSSKAWNLTSKNDSSIPKCERAILTALATCGVCSKSKVAIISGYSVNSGGFNNALSKLRQSAYINGTVGGLIEITDLGRAALEEYAPIPTLPRGYELVQYWVSHLPKCEGEILRALVAEYPTAMRKEQIAERTSYSANSGGFNNALSKLRTLELINRGTEIKASEDLFE